MKDPMYTLKQRSAETKMILDELYQDYKPPVWMNLLSVGLISVFGGL